MVIVPSIACIALASALSGCETTLLPGQLVMARTGFFFRSLAVVEQATDIGKYRLTTLRKSSYLSSIFSIESDLVEHKLPTAYDCSGITLYDLDADIERARQAVISAAEKGEKAHIPTLIAASTKRDQLEIEYAQLISRFGLQTKDTQKLANSLKGAVSRLEAMKQKVALGMDHFEVGEMIQIVHTNGDATAIILKHTKGRGNEPGTLKVALISHRGFFHRLRGAFNVFTSLFGVRMTNTHPIIEIPAAHHTVISRQPNMTSAQLRSAVVYSRAVVQLMEAELTKVCPEALAVTVDARVLVVGMKGEGSRTYNTYEGSVLSIADRTIKVLLDVKDVKARLAKTVAYASLSAASGLYVWQATGITSALKTGIANRVGGGRLALAVNADKAVAATAAVYAGKQAAFTGAVLASDFIRRKVSQYTGWCSKLEDVDADSSKVFCVDVPPCNIVLIVPPAKIVIPTPKTGGIGSWLLGA